MDFKRAAWLETSPDIGTHWGTAYVGGLSCTLTFTFTFYCHYKPCFLYLNAEFLADPDSLVIGLKPPYGKNREVADKYIDHALKFRPRLIALIVPAHPKVPNDYVVVLEDAVTCKVEIFYYPGSLTSVPLAGKRPVLRILAREDLWNSELAMAVGEGHGQEMGWIEVLK